MHGSCAAASASREYVHLAWSRLQDELEVGVWQWYCVVRGPVTQRKACHMYVSMSVVSFDHLSTPPDSVNPSSELLSSAFDVGSLLFKVSYMTQVK